MSRRLRPCRNGPGCARAGAGCDYFHGAELYKSHNPCRFGASCRFKEECVWLHPGEGHLVGRVFWRAAAPVVAGAGGGRAWAAVAGAPRPRAPAAAAGGGAAARAAPRPAAPAAAQEPEYTGPPAPLDDYAILENIKGFLVEKDYVAMRAVSKALRGTIDTHCQMKKIRVNLQQAYELPSLDFVTELTITAQKHYENERPRDGHLARIQRAPMLEKVIFEGADPTHYMDTLARVPTIKIIIVRDFSGDYGNSSDYVRHLVRALPSWPGLVKLKLYKGSQHDHMQALINFLPNLQKLKSLDLNLHSDHALDLAPLSRCVALQSLSLTRAREPVLATVSQLKINKLHIHSGYLPVRRVDANPVLKNLYITHPVGSMKTIRAFVQAFPELVGLNISGASDAAYYEGDEDGVWRWPWLGLKKLKMLTAGSMEIKNHEFTSFCEQLPDGLEQLFVHGLQTTRFQPLIEQLGRLKLWSLGLNGNHCESVLHLARCLTEFAPGLQQLGFTLQNMTYDDARAAIAQFREFAGLRQVYLYKSGFRSTKLHPADFAGLRALLADRPTVLVSDPAIGTHIKKKF